jgi:hypothetical protein
MGKQAKHEELKLTAAEFKRRFMNKAAKARATHQIDLRATIGAGGTLATAGDKKRLKSSWMRREGNPGSFHKGSKGVTSGPALTATALTKHMRTTL